MVKAKRTEIPRGMAEPIVKLISVELESMRIPFPELRLLSRSAISGVLPAAGQKKPGDQLIEGRKKSSVGETKAAYPNQRPDLNFAVRRLPIAVVQRWERLDVTFISTKYLPDPSLLRSRYELQEHCKH